MRRNAIGKGITCLLIAAVFLMAPLNADEGSCAIPISHESNALTLADYLDQQQTQRDSGLGCLYDDEIAQGFVPSSPYDTLTKVELLMRRDTTVIEGLNVTIRKLYDGGDLATVEMTETIPPDTWEWVEFNCDDIPIIPGETYYIIWDGWHGGVEHQNYHWGFGGNDPYPQGTNYWYSTTYDTWFRLEDVDEEYKDIDFCFKTYGYDNQPPDTPERPTGPTHLTPGVSYTFSTQTSDPERDEVQYYFEWGDGSGSTWTPLSPSGQQITEPHMFFPAGYHDIEVKARDARGQESVGWSPHYTVYVEDLPPEAPAISGPTTGEAGTPYTYSITAVDPNMDQMTFRIRWGDGEEDVTGYYDSGQTAQITHTWDEQRIYTVEVRAENTLQSPWTLLDVSMPKMFVVDMWSLFGELIEWCMSVMGREILPAILNL